MTSPSLSLSDGTPPQGWRTELALALQQPELAEPFVDNEPGRKAAYWLAVVLGTCRVRGVELGEEDFTLPIPIAISAAGQLAHHLEEGARDAGNLPKRLDAAEDAVEVNDLCFDVLESRMQVWTAFVAVDEAYHACLQERSARREEFAGVMDRVLAHTRELDRAIQEHLPYLTPVARYPLLDNWRRFLAEEYRDPWPWWLDGRLEEEAARIARDPESWLPRKQPYSIREVKQPDFASAFETLTGNPPFPWQGEMYQWFLAGKFPSSCNLPTGLGKTSIIHIWLLALAYAPMEAHVPRRLVYVVNRRTVVDQSTEEARKLRDRIGCVPGLSERLRELSGEEDREAVPLAISTLRGQFADNREWSANPARPAVIAGTVDMIGSRLLFSGYGCGFKTRPLHAGFLGQDVLLVHDEAHLEPAFQDLLIAIRKEQERCKEFGTFRVMELSATSRSGGNVFELTKEEKNPPDEIPDPPTESIHHAWRRQKAKKAIDLHENKDDKKLAEKIAELALNPRNSGRAVLVFVRKVDDVEKLVKKLPKGMVQQLTGTLRGLERDRMADPRKENGCPIFARFLKQPKPDAPEDERWKIDPKPGTVYLVCTSAGEVGVNISADHHVCDLSTFESMVQRFGRVNRFGERDDTCIDVVYPKELDEKDDYDSRRKKTLALLRELNGDGSPAALDKLDTNTRRDAFSPAPTVLPVSDILFDAWALTTIRGKLPGRPIVEPYLHGVEDEKKAETYVAWREEVWWLHRNFEEDDERKEFQAYAAELLEDYPLKPHELLRDSTFRKTSGVRDKIAKLAERHGNLPVWIQELDGEVLVTILEKAADLSLAGRTVILPPDAGGLLLDANGSRGLLDGMAEYEPELRRFYDVADELYDENGKPRRVRIWKDDPAFEVKTEGMRLVRRVVFPVRGEDEDEEGRSWHWYELPNGGDSDGSNANKKPVLWRVHTDDVVKNTKRFVASLPLSEDVKKAVILAAMFHDLGKRRVLWQRSIGHPLPKNPQMDDWLAKSGSKMQLPNFKTDYRHEFGSLLDVRKEEEFKALKDKPELQDLILHLIAVHHGYGRPHFPENAAFDPESLGRNADEIAAEVSQRFARLQRRYGRWGLAYLESLLRAADYAASAKPSAFVEEWR